MKNVVPLFITLIAIATVKALPVQDVTYAAVVPQIEADPTDPAWKTAAVITELSLSLGAEAKGLTSSPTEIRLLWNDEFLFLRFTCQDDRIESPFQGRDQTHYLGDVVEVFLDPTGNGQHYVELQISPDNQIFDQQIDLDLAPVSDENGKLKDAFLMHHFRLNAVWNMEGLRTATRRFESGWLVDVAIPSRAFGFEKWQMASLRAHLMRYDWRGTSKNERKLIAMNWAPVTYGCPHISPEAMGTLRLLPKK